MISKFFLKSKTIIGAVILGASAFGVVLPFTPDEAEEFLLLLEKLVGLVLIFYGRAKAREPVHFFGRELG